jgi:membrane protease YdiL (CAAX protease family)
MDSSFSLFFWIAGAVLGGAFLQRQIRFIRLQPFDQIVWERYRPADAWIIGGTIFLLFASIVAAGNRPSGPLTAPGVFQAGMFYLVLVMGLVAFLVLRGLSPVELFGLRRPFLGRGMILGMGGLVLCYPLIYVVQVLSYAVGGQPEAQPIVQFLVNSDSWVDRLSVIFVAVLVAPVAEEFLFRGYFYGVLRKWTGRWWGLGISTLVFAGIHGHLPSLAGLALLGLLLGLIYERTGSLWVPIVMHAIFNAASVGVAVFWPELIQ